MKRLCFFFFLYFMPHPFQGCLKEKRDQMFIRPFNTDETQGIDVFFLTFLCDDDNGMPHFMKDEIGEQTNFGQKSNKEQRHPYHTDASTDHFLERHLLTEEEMGWPDDEDRSERYQ